MTSSSTLTEMDYGMADGSDDDLGMDSDYDYDSDSSAEGIHRMLYLYKTERHNK